ncbi:MAG: helix-hairpin-helix domain-containing protein [Bacteroidota bacterium]
MLSAGEIRQAILEEDHKTIQSVKGIGAKTAQRVVLELKDKIQKETWDDLSEEELQPVTSGISRQVRDEALLALTTLGLTRAAAERSIRDVIKKHGTELKLEDIIRLALKRL